MDGSRGLAVRLAGTAFVLERAGITVGFLCPVEALAILCDAGAGCLVVAVELFEVLAGRTGVLVGLMVIGKV
jgi:hypothetical protein